jgi:hypothetical protein
VADPVLASILVRFWLTALRWQLLLRPTKRIGIHRLFAITLIGFMANNVLPARLGEFVRAYALGRSEALARLAALRDDRDRADLRRLHAPRVPGGGLSFLRPTRTLLWAAGLTCGLYLVVLASLLAIRTGHGLGLLTAVLDRLPERVGTPARRLLESFRAGLDVFGDPSASRRDRMLSIVIWVVNALGVEAMFAPSRSTCRSTHASSCSG